jgi:malate dehydrogenase (oxaloacetate-decarboxylating)(NADP+)
MNQWKSGHAANTSARSLADAMKDADVVFGLSGKGTITAEMVKSMADKPIIFAMANPDPEITPEEVKAVRKDAIVATGRSDYPNQVNNVLGFPYIFRGALDVRASTINDAMKIAAAQGLAALAREDTPDEVDAAYAGRRLRYGPDYIIPVPFDPRLISTIPVVVAKAAMETGVARKPIIDIEGYRVELASRLDPTANSLQRIFERLREEPKRVVFAEGEEEKVIRAAIAFRNAGYGRPILIGREERIGETMRHAGLGEADGLEIHNARLSNRNKHYTDFLFARLQRKGAIYRDCQRMVNQDRNVFAACMVAEGDADAMVTGVTRSFTTCFDEITRVIDPVAGQRLFGLSIFLSRNRTVFIADTSVHELPEPDELADITIQTAAKARQFGHEPRVALLSFSNFGNPQREKAERIRLAVTELDKRHVDFEYDGEMQANVALDFQLMRERYPFCRLSGPANILIMPALHSANISAKLLQYLGGGTVIGPVLIGLGKPAQIAQTGANVSDLVTSAAFAAFDALR